MIINALCVSPDEEAPKSESQSDIGRILDVLPVIPNDLPASTINSMSAVPPAVESPYSATVPRLLWDLPSRPRIFFSNLRELVFPGRAEALRLESAPADFWAD